MKHACALLVVAGCASATSQSGGDGATGQDAAIDAPRGFADSATDGPLTDAAVAVDAFVAPDACASTVTELLTNPNLDLAPVGVNWTEIRYLPGAALVVTQNGFNAQSGTQFAYLGDYEADLPGLTADDYLYQDIVIPPGTTQLLVSGFVAVGTADSTTIPYDIAALGFLFPNAPSTTPILVLSLDNTDAVQANSWTPFSQAITQNLSGQTVRLQMESSSDFDLPTAFAFDSLSVRATHGCP